MIEFNSSSYKIIDSRDIVIWRRQNCSNTDKIVLESISDLGVGICLALVSLAHNLVKHNEGVVFAWGGRGRVYVISHIGLGGKLLGYICMSSS